MATLGKSTSSAVQAITGDAHIQLAVNTDNQTNRDRFIMRTLAYKPTNV